MNLDRHHTQHCAQAAIVCQQIKAPGGDLCADAKLSAAADVSRPLANHQPMFFQVSQMEVKRCFVHPERLGLLCADLIWVRRRESFKDVLLGQPINCHFGVSSMRTRDDSPQLGCAVHFKRPELTEPAIFKPNCPRALVNPCVTAMDVVAEAQ